MVCIPKNKKTQNGDGMIDIIKSAFVESKFPGEMHMPGTSYTGPGTRLDIRTSGYPDYIPNGDVGQSVPKLDNISREHDIAHDKIKHDYLEHGDKQTHLKQIHEADDKFTILSALGGKLVGEIYDLVKRKIKGTGYEHKMNHNTLYEKRKFLNHVLNKY